MATADPTRATSMPRHSTGPGDRLVRLHQARAARRLLRAGSSDRPTYPLNFAATVPGDPIDFANLGIMLPLGNSVARSSSRLSAWATAQQLLEPAARGSRRFLLRGRAASTRTWAICPPGYDGIDNDGNGLIDDWARGRPPTTRTNSSRWSRPTCQTHQHNTARAGDALRDPGRGPGAAGLGLQPRRLHRQGKCRTPTTTACPSSSTPGASRSSSSAGPCSTTPTSSAAR